MVQTSDFAWISGSWKSFDIARGVLTTVSFIGIPKAIIDENFVTEESAGVSFSISGHL